MESREAAIPRHKTAIRRGDFSRPVKCLLRDGLLDRSLSFFDYGCGKGEDLYLLNVQKFAAAGCGKVMVEFGDGFLTIRVTIAGEGTGPAKQYPTLRPHRSTHLF